mgnify:CR=1 FL=1
MALSLDDLNRPKKVKSKKNKSADHNRPWENPSQSKKKSETITDDDNTDYLSFLSSEDFPELKLVLNTAMNELQKKSYWLSRFTFKNSWLGRIKTQPKVQIPLPSFLTRKT